MFQICSVTLACSVALYCLYIIYCSTICTLTTLKNGQSTKKSRISAQRILQSSEVLLEVIESSRILTTTTVLSPAALGVRGIFQSCCIPRAVSLDDEPYSTGKRYYYFEILQLLRLEVASGDCLAHTLLKSEWAKPACSGLCPVGLWVYPRAETPHLWE